MPTKQAEQAPEHAARAVSRRTKHVPPPGYRSTRPRYPSFSALNEVLGRHDTVVNHFELAGRYLVAKATSHPAGVLAFVGELAKEYGVSTSSRDVTDLQAMGAPFWIVQTQAAAERFYRVLADEYR